MDYMFDKYLKRGAYHWRQINQNLFQLNAFVLARYQQVLKLIPRKRHQRILDIGCGDGVLLSLIKNSRLYGVDLDQASLDFAVTKVKAKFVRSPAEKLPFTGSFFDVVIATEIIEHLSRPQLMLAEIKRVLKPRGRIIISTPIKNSQGLTDKLHIQEFSPRELQQLLNQYFTQVKIYQSHPAWLKKIYTKTLLKIGRFHFDFFRWLVNAVVIITGYNLFFINFGQPTQQLAVGKK